MRVYFDVCCLNRPLDNQTQDRIRHESEAVLEILTRVERGDVTWVSSDIVDREVGQTPDPGRRAAVRRFLRLAGARRALDEAIEERAREVRMLGFDPADALHIASAEHGGADVFLTVDDRLLRRATRVGQALRVVVQHPVIWLEQQEGST